MTIAVATRSVHPDAGKFPQCSARTRIRKSVPDCYCHHPDYGAGGLVTLAQCLACPFAGSNGPIPPPPPKVGDVFAAWLKKWHRVTETENCSCTSVRQEMNGLGPEECCEQADRLAGKVVENLNATKRLERKLPSWVKRAYFRWGIRRAARYVRLSR